MKRNNILCLMVDEHRHDHLSFFGHPLLKTANIDGIFERGTAFTEAYCNSPLCVPSRISYMTGQYNSKHGGHGFEERHHLDLSQHSFIEPLKASGYRIGLAGKNHTFTKAYAEKWFDDWQEYNHHGKLAGNITESDIAVRDYLNDEPRPEYRGSFGGKANVIQEGLVPGPMPFGEEQCPTWRVAEDTCRFLEKSKDSPFFMQVNFPDPHWPNVTPEPYYSMFDPDDTELEAWPVDLSRHPFKFYVQSQVNGYDGYSEAERKRILATYYGQIMAIDKAIGQILKSLEANGQLDNTIIVYTADHGNFGGRYGLVGKCGVFYDALLRIPLAIQLPGNAAGRTAATVNMVDLGPTLLDAVGLEPLNEMQGKSFLPVLKGELTRDAPGLGSDGDRRHRGGTLPGNHHRRCRLINFPNTKKLNMQKTACRGFFSTA